MKKRVAQNLVKMTAVVGGLALTASAYANAAGKIYVVPSVGYQWFDNEYSLDDEVSFGIALGRQLNDNWAVELAYNTVDTDADFVGEVDADYLHIDALYQFPINNANSSGVWTPYAVLGLGEMNFDSDAGDEDDTQWNFGIGVKNAITSRLSLRGDIRGLLAEDDVEGALLNIGLVYAFGEAKAKAKPVEVAAPVAPLVAEPLPVEDKDTDGDGVLDGKDKCPDTSKGAKVDADGCYKMLTKMKEFTLNVTFASGKSALEMGSVDQIAKLAKFLTSYPQTNVVVEGHTDSLGSAQSNKLLSQKRADAVRQSLISDYQVAAERVTAVGYGEEQPIADNATKEGQAQNRRVVAKVAAEETVQE